MCWQCKNCTRPCGDRLPDGRTDCLASLAVCVLVLPHLIRIFMHALHCHPGERVTACCLLCLLRLVICAINTIVQPIKLEEGLLPPPLLHSLALMAVIKLTVQQQQQQQKGQQQGQRRQVASSEWQVATLCCICISSSSCGNPPPPPAPPPVADRQLA